MYLGQRKMLLLVSVIENYVVDQNLQQIFSIHYQRWNQLLAVDLEMFLEHPNRPKKDHEFQNVSFRIIK